MSDRVTGAGAGSWLCGGGKSTASRALIRGWRFRAQALVKPVALSLSGKPSLLVNCVFWGAAAMPVSGTGVFFVAPH